MPVCAVCSVLKCADVRRTLVLADGDFALSRAAGSVARASFPKGATVCVPSAPTSQDVAHAGSRANCSPKVRALGFSTALQSVVSDTRVQAARDLKMRCCRTLTAKVYKSAAITVTGSARRHWAVVPRFSNAKVHCLRGTAASPKGSSRCCRSLESFG